MTDLLLQFFRWLYLTIGPVFAGGVMALFALAGMVGALVLPFALLHQSRKLYLTGKTGLLKGLYGTKVQHLLEEASRRLDAEDAEQFSIRDRSYRAFAVFAGGHMYQCVSVEVADDLDFHLQLLCPELCHRPFDGFCVNPSGGMYSGGRVPYRVRRSEPGVWDLARACVRALSLPDVLARYSARQVGKTLFFERRGRCADADELIQAVQAIAGLVEDLERDFDQVLFDAFIGCVEAPEPLGGRDIAPLFAAFPSDSLRQQRLLRRCLFAWVWRDERARGAVMASYHANPLLHRELRECLGVPVLQADATAMSLGEDANARRLEPLVLGQPWGELCEQLHLEALASTFTLPTNSQAAVALQLVCQWLVLLGSWDPEGTTGITNVRAATVCAALDALDVLPSSGERVSICHAVMPLLHFEGAEMTDDASILARVCGLLERYGSPIMLESLEQYKVTAPSRSHARQIAWLIERLRDRGRSKGGALSLIDGEDGTFHSGAMSLLAGELGELSMVSEES